MASVELDTYFEGTLDEELPKFRKELLEMGIELEVLNEAGPAGGNPLIKYTGEEAALVAMQKLYF